MNTKMHDGKVLPYGLRALNWMATMGSQVRRRNLNNEMGSKQYRGEFIAFKPALDCFEVFIIAELKPMEPCLHTQRLLITASIFQCSIIHMTGLWICPL
jgi:hypothetical protein